MKVGDLVAMLSGELPQEYEDNTVGIVVDTDDPWAQRRITKYRRIGIMWADGGGTIDYEPTDWLEVISEIR